MKRSSKTQWLAFASSITVLAAVIGWVAHSTWEQLGALRVDLSTLQTKSFHLADHLEAVIRELNEAVLRYEANRNPADAERFTAKAAELHDWIIKQKANVKTARERELLDSIQREFERYRQYTSGLLQPGARGVSSPAIPLLGTLEREAAPYLALCTQFDEAQQWVLNEFGQQSFRTTVLLQRLLIVAVVLLLIFWAVVATVLYRAMLAPLRAKLVETHSLVERQEKLASLGTLAAGVAHEIRNPLTAIKVRLHSMMKMLSSGSSEREDATVIGNEIQRLERIVKDFLLFARPSEPKFIVTTADAVLQHTRELFRQQFEASGIQIHLQPSPPLAIRVDPEQIEQVLVNLVQNAAESIEKIGTVTLRALATRAQLQGRATSAVALEVSDTGKGIPPEVQKRLFDPFFTTRAAGTGLGLSIAARIVETHGGALQYQTKLNHGTTFRVLLPALPSDES